MKLSFNTMIWFGEPISKRCDRLQRYGYDGAEFVYGLEPIDFSAVAAELRSRNLPASSVGCLCPPGRDLSHTDPDIRRATITYMKEAVAAAHEVESPIVYASPTEGLKITPCASEDDEWKWAVAGLRAVGEYAQTMGVRLAVEAWNRYESYMLLTACDTRRMVTEIGLENVGCMLDTFHLNIEEPIIPDAIELTENSLFHMHFADSQRTAPGTGHIDFGPILIALKRINYEGYITMELIPAAGDPFAVVRSGQATAFFDEYTEQTVNYLRKLSATIGY